MRPGVALRTGRPRAPDLLPDGGAGLGARSRAEVEDPDRTPRRARRSRSRARPAGRTSRAGSGSSATRRPIRSGTGGGDRAGLRRGRPGSSRSRLPLVRLAGAVETLREAATGRSRPFNADKAREILAGDWLCDPTPFRRDLALPQPPPLEDGLRETWDWYRKQGWLPEPGAGNRPGARNGGLLL